MHIKQHIPNFIDHGKSEVVEFKSIGGLMEIPWVRDFKKDRNFSSFSIVANGEDEPKNLAGTHTLIAKQSDGTVYVVGYIAGAGVTEMLESLKPRTPRDLETLGGSKTLKRKAPKVYRNDPCTCGSGLKAKKCCYSAYSE